MATFSCCSPTCSMEFNTFLINSTPTYRGRNWNGYKAEGHMLNPSLIQGIFDDQNLLTHKLFNYPDTGVWHTDRTLLSLQPPRPDQHHNRYKSIPIDWGINQERNQAFFDYVKEISGK